MAWVPLVMAAVSAASSMKKGQQESDASAYNVAIAKRDAQVALDQGGLEADQQRRKATLTLGAARALYGASGVTSEGSPIDVLASSAANAEMDNQLIKYRARLRALGYTDTAGLDSASGAAAKSNGYTGAIGSLLGGAADLYSNSSSSSSTGSSIYTGAESAGTGSSY